MATAKPASAADDAVAGTETLLAADDAEHEYPLTIDEWCTQLSATDRRPELIGAFAAIESSAGRGVALPSVFAERYTKFIKTPA